MTLEAEAGGTRPQPQNLWSPRAGQGSKDPPWSLRRGHGPGAPRFWARAPRTVTESIPAVLSPSVPGHWLWPPQDTDTAGPSYVKRSKWRKDLPPQPPLHVLSPGLFSSLPPAVAGDRICRSGHKAHTGLALDTCSQPGARQLRGGTALGWLESGPRSPFLPCCPSVHSSPGTHRDREEAQPMGPGLGSSGVSRAPESHQGLTWAPGSGEEGVAARSWCPAPSWSGMRRGQCICQFSKY